MAEESPSRGGDIDLHLTREARAAGECLVETGLQGAGGGASAWQHRGGGEAGPSVQRHLEQVCEWRDKPLSGEVGPGAAMCSGSSQGGTPRGWTGAGRVRPLGASSGGICLRREGAVRLSAPTRLVHTGLWFDTGGPPASGSTWLCTQWTGGRGPFPKSDNEKAWPCVCMNSAHAQVQVCCGALRQQAGLRPGGPSGPGLECQSHACSGVLVVWAERLVLHAACPQRAEGSCSMEEGGKVVLASRQQLKNTPEGRVLQADCCLCSPRLRC